MGSRSSQGKLCQQWLQDKELDCKQNPGIHLTKFASFTMLFLSMSEELNSTRIMLPTPCKHLSLENLKHGTNSFDWDHSSEYLKQRLEKAIADLIGYPRGGQQGSTHYGQWWGPMGTVVQRPTYRELTIPGLNKCSDICVL